MDDNRVLQIIKDYMAASRFNVAMLGFHKHNNVDSPTIPFMNIGDAPKTFCTAINTTATAAVNIFGQNGVPYNATIVGIFLISLDTTAGTMTIKNNGLTVTTIAKGATAGAMVGATSLANTGYTKGNPLTVVSSSAGNATVFVTYTSS